MQTATRKANVQLAQETTADATLGISGIEETVTVTAEASLIDKDSATIASGLSNDEILALPIAQDYRDLQRFIPARAVLRGDRPAARAAAAAARTTSTSSTA